VRSLDQARILADPLRVRLLTEFVEEPRTTKQVAERLGEKAPKLYRHVQALLDAGLLKRMGEKKKRGTIERYLQAVATRFEVDRSLFATSGAGPRARAAVRDFTELVRTLFAAAQDEILAHGTDPECESSQPTVARVLVRGSRSEVARIQRRIMAIIAASESRTRKQSGTQEVELSGLIAFQVTDLSRKDAPANARKQPTRAPKHPR
jgi:DNA-binding transcriptional ArsR family regulator